MKTGLHPQPHSKFSPSDRKRNGEKRRQELPGFWGALPQAKAAGEQFAFPIVMGTEELGNPFLLSCLKSEGLREKQVPYLLILYSLHIPWLCLLDYNRLQWRIKSK